MMTLAATLALAEPPARKLTDRTWLPPTRVGLRAGLRPKTNGSLRIDAAVQVARLRRAALEVNLGWAGPSGLLLADQVWPRRLNLVSSGVDLLFEPTPLLGLGPSFDLEYRWYRQHWLTIGHTWVPTAGIVADLHVFHGPWYSLNVHVEGRVDLTSTVLTIEGLGSTRLSPLTLEVGLRFCFGHGRPLGAA